MRRGRKKTWSPCVRARTSMYSDTLREDWELEPIIADQFNKAEGQIGIHQRERDKKA